MITKNVQVEESLSKEDYSKVLEYFSIGHKKYGDIVPDRLESLRHRVGTLGVINWACIWNDSSLINHEGIVIASDPKFIVVLTQNGKIHLYRQEDLTFVKLINL